MATRDATQRPFASRLPFVGGRKTNSSAGDSDEIESDQPASNAPPKWSFGVLNDKKTIEVPGENLSIPKAPAESSRPKAGASNHPS